MRSEHPTYSGEAIVNPETHHESTDVNVRALLWFVAIFVVFAAVTHLALWLLFRFFVQLEKGDVRPPLTAIALPGDAGIPATPRLRPFPTRDSRGQVIPPNRNTPATDLQDLRAAEEHVLRNYGWVDQQKGIVRIPIDEAKKLALQRNVFAAASSAVATPAPQSTQGAGAPPKPATAGVQP